jgi:hypothetical protein
MKTIILLLAIAFLHGLDVVRIENSKYGVVYIISGTPNSVSEDGKSAMTEEELVKRIKESYEGRKINNVLAFSFSEKTAYDDAAIIATSVIKKINQATGTYFYAGRVGVSDNDSNEFSRRVAALGSK